MSTYLDVVKDVYAEAAHEADGTLCCTSAPAWSLPELRIPRQMLAMNYGCGSTVDPRDLKAGDTVLYVGVGGGLEALQFAYFARRPGGVLAVDPVADMRAKARANFEEAARLNPWFRPDFVTLLDGSALALPVKDECATVVAQNCLFNVFTENDLKIALTEVSRALKRGGRFFTSDPITPAELPHALVENHRLRARCISGCQTFERYIELLTSAGFGRVEVRARVPYRLLTPAEYPELKESILLESIEVAAYKEPEGPDGPAVFTGRMAIYSGPDRFIDDGRGNLLDRGMPVPVSDAAARRLARLPEVTITPPTHAFRGGGCC
jgi:ubiquinone/menaquinone biosynthesis C-methylase UbiE